MCESSVPSPNSSHHPGPAPPRRHDQLKESEIPALQLRLGEVRAELGTLREAVAELQEVYALADAEAQVGGGAGCGAGCGVRCGRERRWAQFVGRVLWGSRPCRKQSRRTVCAVPALAQSCSRMPAAASVHSGVLHLQFWQQVPWG